MSSSRVINSIIYFCFFLSGITGLVYEVLWSKYLSLFIGHTSYAQIIVLATFMGGLAVGNYLGGKLADRILRWLYAYGWIEIAIGIFCAICPYFLHFLSGWYLPLASEISQSLLLISILRLLISSLIVFLPTILMGATFPLLTRFFVRTLRQTGRAVGWLYFINSLGAAVGCVVSGFFLIRYLGLHLSMTLAAILNVVVGLLAIGLSKIKVAEREALASVETDSRLVFVSERLILVAIFAIAISGFTSMIYEVSWIRFLSLILGSSTYSFSLMLAAFIFGIAIGGLVISKFADRSKDPYALFALTELGIAIALLFTLPLYPRLPYIFLRLSKILVPSNETFFIYQFIKLKICFLVMLAPCIFFGMTLPLASKIASSKRELLGRRVGNVFAWNTVGTLLGATATGLILMPIFGLKQTIQIGVVLNLIIGCILFILAPSFRKKLARIVISFIFLGSILWLCFLLPWKPESLASGVFRYRSVPKSYESFLKRVKQRDIHFYKDGVDLSVSVYTLDKALVLTVNGKVDAGTHINDMRSQKLLAHIPMLLHPNPKQVLLIGLGSGITAGSLLQYPRVKVDVVEISKAVVEGSKFFKPYNYNVLTQKRLKLYLEDAKTFLQLCKKKYDIIISAPSNPWIAGIANLFSKEYFEEIKRHLKKDGIILQWFHTYEMTDDIFKMVVRTFTNIIPYTTVWSSQLVNIFMVGSLRPLKPNFSVMEARFSSPKVKRDLSLIDIKDLPCFLFLQVLSERNVLAMSGSGLINSDYFPILEYEAPRGFYLGARSNILHRWDERRNIFSRKNLLIWQYIQKRPLTSRNFSNIFQHIKDFPSTRYGKELQHSLILQWINQYPEDEEARWVYVRFLLTIGERKLALKIVRELMLQTRKVQYIQAYIKLKYKQFFDESSVLFTPPSSELISILKRGIKESPKLAYSFEAMLGQIYMELGDYKKAKYYLARAKRTIERKKQTKDTRMLLVNIYLSLGRIYLAEGKIEQGRRFLISVLKLSPRNEVARGLLLSSGV